MIQPPQVMVRACSWTVCGREGLRRSDSGSRPLTDLGPSTALRKWFGHDSEKWNRFHARHRAELTRKQALLTELAGYARGGKLTLVYSARDPARNQAVVTKEMLEGIATSPTS